MEDTEEFKKCPVCGETKPLSCFVKNRRPCKDCINARKREEERKRYKKKLGVWFSDKKGRLIEYGKGKTKGTIYWSPSDISMLKRLYPTTLNAELAELFNVSNRTLIRKANELGLKKDKEWMVNRSKINSLFYIAQHKAIGYPNLRMARKALADKYNNPNYTRCDVKHEPIKV